MSHMFHVKLRRLIGVLAASCVFILGAGAVSAHGGDPLPRRVHDVDGQWLLVTNFGIIAQDSPARYVCEEAFLGGDGFLFAPVSRREWMTFSSSVIMRTYDGCSFERVAQLPKLPSAVDVAPDRGTIAYVINDDGLPALSWTRDFGSTFERLDLASVGDVHWTGLALGAGDVVYLSGYSRRDEDRGGAVIVSVELEGGAIERHTELDGAKFPYLFEAGGGRLAGIASVDEQLVLFWGAPGELSQNQRSLNSWPTGMWTDEAGAELHVASVEPLGGVLRGVRDGSGAITWTESMPEHSAKCVGVIGDQLYLCARRDREMHDLSVVRGGEASRAVSFEELQGPDAACEEQSDVARTCGVVWPELARALRIELPDEPGDMSDEDERADMGEPLEDDMGAEETLADMASVMVEPGMEPEPPEAGTCSASGRAGGVGGAWLWAALLFGVRRRRRSLSGTI